MFLHTHSFTKNIIFPAEFYSSLERCLILIFSFGIVIPKGRNYLEVPAAQNDIKTEIVNINPNETSVAPWNYCVENQEKWDYIDTLESLRNASSPCM